MRGSKNYCEKVAGRWKYQSMQFAIWRRMLWTRLTGIHVYMPIYIYPIILTNLARKVWLNYPEVTLNFYWEFMFLITEGGTKIYATA